MNGRNLFLGMNYVDAKFVEEAESTTELKFKNAHLPTRRIILIAAIVALMLFLMGSAVVSMVRMRISDIGKVVENEPTLVGTITENNATSASESEAYTEVFVGEAVHFEEVHDVFIELGAYYPQKIHEGYSMTFISEGAPLSQQEIVYENDEGYVIIFRIYIGDAASNVEVYRIVSKTDVTINGQPGILYEQENNNRTLVWVNERQGYGFYLSSDDMDVDLLTMAESTASGEPLVPSRSEKTVQALEELGDYSPSYLPEGYEEQGVMGSPLEDGGGWYSYVRKYYVNKTENASIYFEYESYTTETPEDEQTICDYKIPQYGPNGEEIIGQETEICGMYGLTSERDIAWIDPENKVIYHLHSEDVTGETLLQVAQSILVE